MKNKKKLRTSVFSYSKSMANFEAFNWNISSSVNLFFLNGGAEIPKKPIEQMFFMLFNLDFLLVRLDTFFNKFLKDSMDVFYGTRTLKSIDYSKNN